MITSTGARYMSDPYATVDDLVDFLASVTEFDDTDATRLLARASELVDEKVRAPFAVDTAGILQRHRRGGDP